MQQDSQRNKTLEDLIKNPEKLQLLVLAGTDIPKQQISVIFLCQNLMKLDISNNNFENLNIMPFQNLKKLRILYLHQNQIRDLSSLNSVFQCENINYLSIYQNPCASQTLIRHQIIQNLKKLKALDFNAVTDEERNEDLFYSTTYYSANNQRTKLSWPIVSYFSEDKLQKNRNLTSEQKFLSLVWKELDIINRAYIKSSAIICIQRNFRKYKFRQELKVDYDKKKKIEIKVRKIIKQWKKFVQNKKELHSFLVSHFKKQAEQFITNFNNMKQQKKSLVKLQDSIVKIVNFIKTFSLNLNLTMKSLKFQDYQKIYIQKDQLPIFNHLLNQMKSKAEKLHMKTFLNNLNQVNQTPYNETDFPRPFKLYQSSIKTYRLPFDFNLQKNKNHKFTNMHEMMWVPSKLAKVACTFITKKKKTHHGKSQRI